MNDIEQFVTASYRKLLGQDIATEKRSYYTAQISAGRLSRESFLFSILDSKEFSEKNKIKNSEFVPAGHFYSVIPSDNTIASYKNSSIHENDCPGISIDLQEQLALLQECHPFYLEAAFPEKQQSDFRYYYHNYAFSWGDALYLYFIMRKLKPKQIVEVGSGFSSALMLDTNERYLENSVNISFIEPYTERLQSLMKDSDHVHTILENTVQEVSLDTFASLNENDILFIDSTHVSKLDSDVNYLFFEVLPALKSGTYIHIHDIFWRFEYPELWIKERKLWNEAYLLRAFLQYNNEFEIVLFANYLACKATSWIQEHMPAILNNPGGSIWLRKR